MTTGHQRKGATTSSLRLTSAWSLPTWATVEIAAFVGLVLAAATPLVPHVAFRWGASLDDILPVTAVVFMTPYALTAPRPARVPGPVLAVVGALAVLAVAGFLSSTASAPTAGEGVHMILRSVVRLALLGWLGYGAYCAVGLPRGRERLARALALVGIVEALIGVVAFVVPLPAGIGMEPARVNSVLFGLAAGRVNGTLGLSPDFLGAIFLFTLPFTVSLALDSQRWPSRTAWLAATTLQLVALTLTLTRASTAIGVAEVVALLAVYGQRRLIIASVLVAIGLALATPLGTRFLMEGNDRMALWSSALGIARDYPLLGVGPGRMLDVAAADPIRYQVTAFGTATNSAHNSVLLAAAELGVAGGLAAAVLAAALVVQAGLYIVAAWRSSRRALETAAGLAIVGFVSQSMVNNLFTVAVTATYATLVFAAFLVPQAQRDEAVHA